MKLLFLFVASLNVINNSLSQFLADPTTLSGTISQTTTTFYTPPTRTSTFFVTYTPPTSIKMVTKTATPSTSVVVSVTVVNINAGGGKVSKLPKFLGYNFTADSIQLASISSAASATASSRKTSSIITTTTTQSERKKSKRIIKQ